MDAKRNGTSVSADATAGSAVNMPAKSINKIRMLPVMEEGLFAIFTLPGYSANLMEDPTGKMDLINKTGISKKRYNPYINCHSAYPTDSGT
jgi:hypothetical protein